MSGPFVATNAVHLLSTLYTLLGKREARKLGLTVLCRQVPALFIGFLLIELLLGTLMNWTVDIWVF